MQWQEEEEEKRLRRELQVGSAVEKKLRREGVLRPCEVVEGEGEDEDGERQGPE